MKNSTVMYIAAAILLGLFVLSLFYHRKTKSKIELLFAGTCLMLATACTIIGGSVE